MVESPDRLPPEFKDQVETLAALRKAYDLLRHREERFRSVFDHAAIGMAIVALDGRFLQVNPSFCRITGYASEELEARDFQSITHPDDLHADLDQANKLLAGAIPDYQMIKRYVRRDSRLVSVLLSVSLVRDAAGNPLHFVSQVQDVTERSQAEVALKASEEEFRASFELASVGKMQIDLRTGRFLRVNAKLCQMTGYSVSELYGMTFADITHPDDIGASKRAALGLLRGHLKEYNAEKRYVCKDGRIIWVIINAAALYDEQHRPLRSFATVQDVTERKMAEWLERDRRRVLELVALDAPLDRVLGELAKAVELQLDGTAAILALQEGILSVHAPTLSPQWLGAIEEDRFSLASKLTAAAWKSEGRCGVSDISTDDAWLNLRPLAASQNIRSCWTYVLRSTDETPTGLLLVFSRREGRPTATQLLLLRTVADLGKICIDHHTTTRQLAHLVRHDPLTGLPNRVFFQDRLQQAVKIAARTGKPLALLALDVDHFKQINDTLGHDAGDAVLRHFAERISGQLRQADTIARIGGDEFMIVLPEMQDVGGAVVVAQKLVDCLREPFHVCGQDLTITTSIGIAAFPGDGPDVPTLQRRADEQMYLVKRGGRNGFSIRPTPAAV